MERDALGRGMRLSVAEGGLATAMGSLFSGVFLTGFALSLGASRLQIGILFALPSVCGIAQLLGSYLIERHGGTKPLCLWATAVSRLLFLPVLTVPFLIPASESQANVWWVVALMAASHLFGSIGGVAWLTWIKGFVPAAMRLPFFGRRNLVNTALSFALCLAGGAMLDFWRANDQQFTGFAVVFAVAMVCGGVSWFLMRRIPAAECTLAPTVSFRQTMLLPLRETNYRRVVFFYAAWNFAVNIAAPFIPVFYLQRLGLPFWYIVVLNTLSSLVGLVANGFWTRLAQRFGIKPVVLLATLGDALYPLCLVFVDQRAAWVLFAIHLTGLFNTPISIGPDNFVLKLAPDRNASSYMAVFRTIVGLMTALAAVSSGWLSSEWTVTDVGSGLLGLGGLRTIFLISCVGRLVSLFVLSGVTEPKAESLLHVARVYQRSRRRARARLLVGKYHPEAVTANAA